ncbi:hypothetical protein SAMN05518669_10511 [Variovorax sp. YR634]|uniref:hypothetical protein n=1 Tax=unclassified Variovorax TaxID=663243 RepID=UPI0008958824|nr:MULTISPECIES: hypothetical protein [unclassified Variovorax]SDX47310.1 hypothetical protein SAMN05518669_10511 [Variovorax sp. YR634]SOD28518.1 hypothetical protein SAMN05518800_4094 [Variovorax sp. YR752]
MLAMAIRSIFEEVANQPLIPKHIDAYTAKGGFVIKTQKQYRVLQDGIYPYFSKDQLLSKDDAIDHASFIDANTTTFASDTQAHRNILNNPLWKKLFGIQQRQLLQRDAKSLTESTHPFESAPCAICGICLPISLIEIDHDHPTAGIDDAPVLKMLRAMAMTVYGPKGPMGQAILRQKNEGFESSEIPDNLRLHKPKGQLGYLRSYELAPAPIAPYTGKYLRHTTVDSGNVLLSLMYSKGDLKFKFVNACRNSVVNLAPLCKQCNTRKGKKEAYTHIQVEASTVASSSHNPNAMNVDESQ